MSFESDFRAALNTGAAGVALAALVGENIVPSHEERPSPPYVVYQTIHAAENYSLDGPTGLSRVRMQADVYAETQDEARLIATALAAAVPESGFPLHGICINEVDFGLEEGARLVRRMVEWSLVHGEQ